jgi:hypothetical protein
MNRVLTFDGASVLSIWKFESQKDSSNETSLYLPIFFDKSPGIP